MSLEQTIKMMNFKKIAVLIGSVSSVLIASPAFADWQFTKWDMTLAELQSTSPVELGRGDICPVNNSNSAGLTYQVEATSAWKVGDMDFTACYLFLNGKLHVINLFSQNADPQAVVKGLTQKYGEPVINTRLREVGIVRYVWDKPDEKIEFSVRSFAGVDYPYLVSYQSKSGSNETSARDQL